YLGHDHAAVGLLVLLEDRHQRASNGERRAVQGVHQLRFGFGGWAKADLGAARLEITKRAAARNLAVRLLARQPHLEVVALERVGPEVASAQLRNTVV